MVPRLSFFDGTPDRPGSRKGARHDNPIIIEYMKKTWILALALCLAIGGSGCQWQKERKAVDAPTVQKNTPDKQAETPRKQPGDRVRTTETREKLAPTRDKPTNRPPATRAASPADGRQETWVYICNSATSARYHKYSTCRGLKKCSKEITRVSRQSATNKNLTPCKICYK
jgi:hypothetical protein